MMFSAPDWLPFIDYYAHIKAAELERFRKEAGDQPEVTAWEQKEYLDLF